MTGIVHLCAAAGLVADGDAVLFGGSGGGRAVPEAVIEGLSERYRTEGAPLDLTLASAVSLGDWETAGFTASPYPGARLFRDTRDRRPRGRPGRPPGAGDSA